MIVNDIINSPDKILSLTTEAAEDSDNFKNFEKRLPGYIAFHIAIYEGVIIGMAGMFQSKFWDSKLVRVCDRTYYFKEARSGALSFLNEKNLKATASDYILPLQTKIALEKGLIPFYSIQGIRRRPALDRQVERFNKKNTYQYNILPEMYYTCNSLPSDNELCWQNVSLLKTEGNDIFNLPSRPIK